jgi:class 3 adenylate cyclase
VNLAARLEAWGKPGTIVVNAAVRDALARSHAFEPLGTAELKGIGVMDIFRLVERKSTDLPH